MEEINGEVHYIYTIKDPRTDTIFYVGRTKNIDQRIAGHVSANHHVIQIIKSGFKPVFNIVHKCDIKDVGYYENIFIEYYENQGYHLDNSISVRRRNKEKQNFILTTEKDLEIESQFAYPLK